MNFSAILADENGETHFADHNVPDRDVPFGPPPNPTGKMTDFGAVTSMFLFSVPAGTDVPAHNAPQPYVCIIISGQGEVSTSDGETRRFSPGDILFCDDLVGKGHVTRAITDLVAAFVNRAQA
jgi:quercetin dioxygenase-like cupin family protein